MQLVGDSQLKDRLYKIFLLYKLLLVGGDYK